MLKTKEVEVNACCNVKHYEDKGYYIPKNKGSVPIGTKITVKVEDLPKGSGTIVEVLCDYCLEDGIETILKKKYCTYLYQNENAVIHKDCCKKHSHVKQKEYWMQEFGVECNSQLPDYIIKRNKTCQEKYGVDNVFQLDEIKEKSKNTCIQKYGKENYTQTEEYLDKTIQTNMAKYNSEWYITSDTYKNHCIEKWGVDNPVKNNEYLEKRQKNVNLSLSKNNKQKVSNAQLCIHSLLNGELNYLIEDKFFLDIALVDEKIYIEYDGSGHNIPVIRGWRTQERQNQIEMNRFYFLKRNGWKMIRIVSLKDRLPSKSKLLDMIQFAKDSIKKHRTWIIFDIDNNIYKNKEGEFEYDYGELRNIRSKKDIDKYKLFDNKGNEPK